MGERIGVIKPEQMSRQAMGGVRHMAMLALEQLRDVLDSFARGNVTKAVEVWARDQHLDRLYTSLFRELLTRMIEDPSTAIFGVHLVFCTKNIERIGDHTTNIAEAVHYMVKGYVLWEDRPKADLTPSFALDVESLRSDAYTEFFRLHHQVQPPTSPDGVTAVAFLPRGRTGSHR